MYKWIKKQWKRYCDFTVQSYEQPTVYKIGKKKYIKVKRFSKGPVPRTRYDK